MSYPLKNILAISLVIFITSCTSISLTGMYKLSQTDPLSVDPAQLQVALKTDKAIQVKDGAVEIKFGYKSDDGSIDIHDEFLVQIDNKSKTAHALFDEIKANEFVTVLLLSEADAKKFQQNQQVISAHRAQDKKGQGIFSLGLSDFCLPDPLPERDLMVDVYLQLAMRDGFFKFLSNVNLKEQLEDINPEELAALNKECQKT